MGPYTLHVRAAAIPGNSIDERYGPVALGHRHAWPHNRQRASDITTSHLNLTKESDSMDLYDRTIGHGGRSLFLG